MLVSVAQGEGGLKFTQVKNANIPDELFFLFLGQMKR